jgi:hypothetical protein
VLDAGAQQRCGRIRAGITADLPEVLREVFRILLNHRVEEDRERAHADGFIVVPACQRESHSRDLSEHLVFLAAQSRVGIAAAARFHRILNRGEAILQDAQREQPHREHIRNRHRRAHDIRHEAIPNAGRILGAADGTVSAAAPSKRIAVSAMGTVDLGRQSSRVSGRSGVCAIGRERRVFGQRRHPALVGLDEVSATCDRETHLVLWPGPLYAFVLTARRGRDVLKEATLVPFLRREVDRKAGFRALEPSMHVLVADRRVPPFVDVHIGLAEERIGRGWLGGHPARLRVANSRAAQQCECSECAAGHNRPI